MKYPTETTFKSILERMFEIKPVNIEMVLETDSTQEKEDMYQGYELLFLKYILTQKPQSVKDLMMKSLGSIIKYPHRGGIEFYENIMILPNTSYFKLGNSGIVEKLVKEPNQINLRILSQIFFRYNRISELIGTTPIVMFNKDQTIQPINFSDLSRLDFGYGDKKRIRNQQELISGIKALDLELINTYIPASSKGQATFQQPMDE